MLDRCKAVAKRAGLKAEQFDLKTFRSTYATRMLRAGFDVRTVQHWMGHKSLETTMRYLVPATEVHAKLDQIDIPGIDEARRSNVEPSRDARKSPASEGNRRKPRRKSTKGTQPLFGKRGTLADWSVGGTREPCCYTPQGGRSEPEKMKTSPCKSSLNCRKTSRQDSRRSGRICRAPRLKASHFEAHRSHSLSTAQLRRLLGFQTRMQVDAFLKEHEVYDLPAEHFEQDRETLRQVRASKER